MLNWPRFSQSISCGGLLMAALAMLRPAAALTIAPTFDTSITGAPNAAQLEASINAASSLIGSLYSSPGSVGIVFTQAPGAFLAQSQTADYALSYTAYVTALTAASNRQASNTVLATSIANLSSGNRPGPGGSVILTSADARVALGLFGFTGCYNTTGTFVGGCGQRNDGVVTISTSQTLNYGLTPLPGAYSVRNAIEHEINEILGGGGQGTVLNQIAVGNSAFTNSVGVLDLYRYAARGVPTLSASASVSSYFSIDGGATAIVGFNQASTGDLADFSTNDNIQSATLNAGIALPYDALSPEYTMLEAIGYAGAVPEPASLAILITGMAGLKILASGHANRWSRGARLSRISLSDRHSETAD
jgi:hypothetical protein